MDGDQIIKLILETQGAEGLQRLADAALLAKHSLADSSEAGELASRAYKSAGDAAESHADREIRAAAERTNAQRSAARELGESTAKTSRSFVDLERVVQDFSQGGLAGVLSNVEGLTAALGGSAGLVGALTLVGAGIITLTPQLKGFFDAVNGRKFAFPDESDELDGLTEAYARNAKELEALKEQGSLDLADSFRAKDLVAEQKRLGKEIADARAVASVTGDQADAPSRRGAAVRRAIAEFGGGKDLVAELAEIHDASFAGGKTAANESVAKAMQGRDGYLLDLLKVPGFAKLWNEKYDPAIEDKARADARAKQDADRKQRDRDRKKRGQERWLDDRTNADVAVLEDEDRENARAAAEAARLQERSDREAPRRALQARLGAAGRDVSGLAGRLGMDLTPEQTLEGARTVVELVGRGVDRQEAATAALNELVVKAHQLSQRLQAQQVQAMRIQSQARSLTISSDTFFPGGGY